MTFELKMPDLSTTGSPIKVLRWLVAVGDFVEGRDSVHMGSPIAEKMHFAI